MQGEMVRIRAGFGVRAAAWIIDRAIIFLALLFIRIPVWVVSLLTGGSILTREILFQHTGLNILCWLLAAVYLVLMTYYTGGTLGKKVMRLRVEKEDGGKVRFVDVLYRETIGRFLSKILCLGYLMVLVDRKDRAFHDWLCDPYVVYDAQRFAQPDEAVFTDADEWHFPGAGTDPGPVMGPGPFIADIPITEDVTPHTPEGTAEPGGPPDPWL